MRKIIGFPYTRPVYERNSPAKLQAAGNTQAGIISRKSALEISLSSLTTVLLFGTSVQLWQTKSSSASTRRKPDDVFEGTSLPLLSLDEAYSYALISKNEDGEATFPFAQWPDPILRRPASRQSIPCTTEERARLLTKLQTIAEALRQTAKQKNAVGLAAQQCGIDLSLIFLQTRNPLKRGIFLLNPRIVQRSPEEEMLVWEEECLVLPPSFRATVLRDARVTVEYETIFDNSRKDNALATKQVNLHGELARAVQHEMQHDEGILILDHVDQLDLPSYMQENEIQGHKERMQIAFSRSTVPSTMSSTSNIALTQQTGDIRSLDEILIPSANAAEVDDCDEHCLADREKRIAERRAMMQQSRTNTNRQDLFSLSQQRAVIYNTTYQGATCPPSVPCI